MEEKTFFSSDRSQWRNWLQENHDSASLIWLVFYKKHTGKDCISYDESVEEALCFGWIDSIIKKIDDDRYARKFTPRKPGSKWSKLNIKRVKRMIDAGRMTQQGLDLAEPALKNPELIQKKPADTADPEAVPLHLREALQEDKLASSNFEKFPPSSRKLYISWIDAAKKEETKIRRARKAVELIRKNEKSPMV